MKKIALACVGVVLLAGATAHANVAIQVTSTNGLKDENGVLLSQPTLTIATLDLDGDGCAQWLVNKGPTDTFNLDLDDMIIAGQILGAGPVIEWDEVTGTTEEGGNDSWLISRQYEFPLDGIPVNTPVSLYWFPGLDLAATEPGPNQPFGCLTWDPGLPPGDNQARGLLDIVGVEPFPAGNFSAIHMTAPEPATLVLLLAGGGLLAARRRRQPGA